MRTCYIDLTKYHNKQQAINILLNNIPVFVECINFKSENIGSYNYIVYNNENGKHTLYATNVLQGNPYINRLILTYKSINKKFGRTRLSNFVNIIKEI